MKVFKIFGLLVLGAFVLGVTNSVTALELGNTAPKTDVKMKSVDGSKVSIADVRGEKGTMVIFTCNSCPWVQAWDERIAETANSYQERGVGVIAINPNDPSASPQDDYDAMKERAHNLGMKYPYVVDATSDVARAFNATRTPEVFLFDSNGQLVYHGTIDDNAKNPAQVEKPYLKNALEAVVNNNEVPTKLTKSIGCTIKFRSS